MMCFVCCAGPDSRYDTAPRTRFRRNIVIASLVLPFNCIWLYAYVGNPVLGPQCRYYDEQDGVLMVSAVNETFPPRQWHVSPLGEVPAQPYCETAINTYFD